MPLEVLERVGVSLSGAPIHRVKCTLCGDEYRVTGARSHIETKSGCSDCYQRKQFGRGVQKRLREALASQRFRLAGAR